VIRSVIGLGSAAKEQEVRAILDGSQWQRWQETCKSMRTGARVAVPKLPAISKTAEDPLREPEEIEGTYSTLFNLASESRRGAYLEEMMIRAEDVARVCGLSDGAKARLQTAARGAVEEQMTSWRSEFETSTRAQPSQLVAVGVGQVRIRLGQPNLQPVTVASAENGERWKKALERELTPAQQASWKESIESRRRYFHHTIAETVLAAVDRKVTLTEDQWSKIEPKVEQFIQEYETDLENYYTSTAGTSALPWYSYPHLVYIPFVGIPLAEMDGILEEEQWTRWKQSSEQANAARIWPILKRNHDRAAAGDGKP
jgi:hypothetical protein